MSLTAGFETELSCHLRGVQLTKLFESRILKTFSLQEDDYVGSTLCEVTRESSCTVHVKFYHPALTDDHQSSVY